MFPRAGDAAAGQWIGLLLPLTYFLQVLRGHPAQGRGTRRFVAGGGDAGGLRGLLIAVAVRRFHKTLD